MRSCVNHGRRPDCWLIPLLRGMALVGCFALSLNLSGRGNSPSTPREDRSWKHYRNPSLGYCLSYPSRWRSGNAFDGAGMYVLTGVKRNSNPIGEIDFGPVADLNPSPPHAATVSLADDLEAHLQGLKQFERAERMELLDKREMTVEGEHALFTKNRYYDPLERATWLEEVVLIAHQQRLYRLELECRADQTTRFEPVFTRLLDSFRFNCPAEPQ